MTYPLDNPSRGFVAVIHLSDHVQVTTKGKYSEHGSQLLYPPARNAEKEGRHAGIAEIEVEYDGGFETSLALLASRAGRSRPRCAESPTVPAHPLPPAGHPICRHRLIGAPFTASATPQGPDPVHQPYPHASTPRYTPP